ncbi:MAG: sigma-70 family RNA polymerase sigma factor, partial [Blastococcus sp.]
MSRSPAADCPPVEEEPLHTGDDTAGATVPTSGATDETPGATPDPAEVEVDEHVASTDGVPSPRAGGDAVAVPVEPVEAVAEVVAEPDPPPLSDNRRRAERTAPLFVELAGLEKGDPRRERLREILVEEHLPLVRHFARRFSNRGEPFDDLLQVGTLGLIAAIDRFDPTRGVEFLSFAVPTITGEIKRHFRDQGWSVRVPRRLQELHLSLNAAVGELAQKNGRAPTPSELAAHLGIPRAEVLEGLAVANAYRSSSLDERLSGEDDSPTLAAT